MESVDFLGTVYTSRTDEGTMDMDNCHIQHKVSVEYSSELCSQDVFSGGTSSPGP